MSANLLVLNPTNTEFVVIGNPQQLAKLSNSVLTLISNTTIVPVQKARNLGVALDNHLSLHSQITALSQSCFYHNRDLRRIRDTLDFKTASTTYCNCLSPLKIGLLQLSLLQSTCIWNSAPTVHSELIGTCCLSNIKIHSYNSNVESSSLA